MRKLKEINLNVDTSKYSSPHSKGKQPYYQGFSGGMNDSAASTYSSYMGAKKYPIEPDDEEDTFFLLQDDEEDITNEEQEVYKSYEKEVIEEIISFRKLSLLEFVEKNKDINSEMIETESMLIGDIIDLGQRLIELAPLPGEEVVSFFGGQFLAATIGTGIKGLGSKYADFKGDHETMAKMIEIIPAFATLASGPFAFGLFPAGYLASKIVSRALVAVGNSTDITGTTVYSPDLGDVASDVVGDAAAALLDTFSGDTLSIPASLAWIVKNLIEIHMGTKRLEKLIESSAGNSKQTFASSVDQEMGTQTSSMPSSSELRTLIDKALAQGMMSEFYEFGIDEDKDEEGEDEELDEFSGAGGVGGVALPLGRSTKSSKGKHSSKTGGTSYPYTKASQDRFKKYANKTVGSINEEANVADSTKSTVLAQVWSHKTLGNIRYK